NYVREPQTDHFVTAFAIDPKSGALTKHGERIRLPQRPIHVSTDIPSDNILVAFPNPSAVRVYRINKDATLGAEVKQPGSIDPDNPRTRHAAGTPHMQSNSSFPYGANRADQTGEFQRKKILKGGANSTVVYATDQSTGDPKPIQHADTHKLHPPTSHTDTSGK